jgi:hypothetical protein
MCTQVEVNFLDYVVTPLWERLVEVVPELLPCYVQLRANRNRYNDIATALPSAPSLNSSPTS